MALRNLQKIVSASAFAAKSHNYLLNNVGRSFNPASLYFNPKDKTLAVGHSYDPFALSLIAYELTRQNNHLRQALNKIGEDNKKAAIRTEITDKIDENEVFIKNYSTEVLHQLKTNVFDVPVETCSNVIFALENTAFSQRESYQSLLIPIIKEKFDYLSFDGLSHLLNGLVRSKTLEDKALVKAILARLSEKASQLPERSFVGLAAWKVDRYHDFPRKTEAQSEYLQFVRDITGGSLAGLKHWLRVSYAYLENNVLFRLFYREARIYEQFDQVDEKEEITRLIGDLAKLQELDTSFNTKDLVENLRKI